MRRKSLFTLLFAAAIALGASRAMAEWSVSVSDFHDQLAPHGRWVAAGSYGSCWVPGGVAAGWSPYVDGEWVYTDYGWTWESDDSWGDIPYHYGTWAWTSDYGWVWVPGTVWAPSWVTWAYTDDYIGWAPVPVSFGFTAGGYVGAPVVVDRARFVFVPARQFVGVRVGGVRVDPRRNAEIFARAHRVTGFQVSSGIVRNTALPVATVQRITGRRIEVRRIDAARLHPTQIAAAGASRRGRLSVVAPARERAAAGTSASRRETVARAKPAEKRPVKAQPAPKVAERSTRSHPAEKAPARRPADQTARRKAETRKPAAESRQRETVAGTPQRSRPSPPREASPVPHARQPEAREAHRAPQAASPQAKASERRPDERVASAHPAPKPPPRPRPAPKRQEPPRKPEKSGEPQQN